MKKVLAILGPTSSGKTDVAINIAKKFNGQLISADSRQVYKGLDIGTGKLPSINDKVPFEKEEGYWILDGVRVWLYDICDPKDRYDVFQYVDDAKNKIEEISSSEKLPIIVGGTGLYIRSLIEGLSNLNTPVDQNLRQKLEKLNLEKLQQKLIKLSPKIWESLNNSEKNNQRRLIRKIELLSLKPIKDKKGFSGLKDCDILKIGLFTDRKILNQNIDKRVESRIKQGLIEEAEKLYDQGLSLKRMRELGLEYRCLADFLEGKTDKRELVEILKTKIHQFAKRQVTYFKKEKNVVWFDITERNFINKVEKHITDWYNNKSEYSAP